MNIFLFWFMNDWGLYGRAYEKIAENLAKLPEIERVICTFPPAAGSSVTLIDIRKSGEELIVVSKNYDILSSDYCPYKIRKIVNRFAAKYLLNILVRKLKLKREKPFSQLLIAMAL